jgi:hypothetical protein
MEFAMHQALLQTSCRLDPVGLRIAACLTELADALPPAVVMRLQAARQVAVNARRRATSSAARTSPAPRHTSASSFDRG